MYWRLNHSIDIIAIAQFIKSTNSKGSGKSTIKPTKLAKTGIVTINSLNIFTNLAVRTFFSLAGRSLPRWTSGIVEVAALVVMSLPVLASLDGARTMATTVIASTVAVTSSAITTTANGISPEIGVVTVCSGGGSGITISSKESLVTTGAR